MLFLGWGLLLFWKRAPCTRRKDLKSLSGYVQVSSSYRDTVARAVVVQLLVKCTCSGNRPRRLRGPSGVANDLCTNSNLSFKIFDYVNIDSNTELVVSSSGLNSISPLK